MSIVAQAGGALAADQDYVRLGVSGLSGTSIQVTGTWTGTITFECLVDTNTFVALNTLAASGTTAATTTIANGVFRVNVAGLTVIQTRMSTFGSGRAVVSIKATESPFFFNIPPASVTPGGADGDVQYNNAGAFGGIAQTLFAIDRTNLRVGFFNAAPSVPVHESPAALVQYTDIGGAVAKSGHVMECTTTDTSTTANRMMLAVLVANLASNPSASKVIAALAGNVSTPVGLATNLNKVSFRGLNATSSHNGSNVLRDIFGGQYNAFNNSTGTVTNVVGVRSVVNNNDAAGVITNYKAFEAVDIINVGTIVDTYGFYCGVQKAGTQTNKAWAYYNADPDSVNYFAGATVPRVTVVSDATSITPDTRYCNMTQQTNTQAAGTLTINADAGVSSPQPYNAQSWTLKIKSTNVQTFAWNAVYKGGAQPLPTNTTGASKIDYFAFLYDTIATKWHYTGSSTGF